MSTRAQMQEQLVRLTRERDEAVDRATRAEETNAAMTDVVGYYILRTDNREELWDGTLHPTLSAASRSFWDPRTREVVSGDGWDIYECRRIHSEGHTP